MQSPSSLATGVRTPSRQLSIADNGSSGNANILLYPAYIADHQYNKTYGFPPFSVSEPLNASAAQDDHCYSTNYAGPSTSDPYDSGAYVPQSASGTDASWLNNQSNTWSLPQPTYVGEPLASLSEGPHYQDIPVNSVAWQGYQQPSTASTFGAEVYRQGCASGHSQSHYGTAASTFAQGATSSVVPPVATASGPSTCTGTGPVRSASRARPAPYCQPNGKPKEGVAHHSSQSASDSRSRILHWSIPVVSRSKSRCVEEISPQTYSDLAVSNNIAISTYANREHHFPQEADNDPSIPGPLSNPMSRMTHGEQQGLTEDPDPLASLGLLDGDHAAFNSHNWQQAYRDMWDQEFQRQASSRTPQPAPAASHRAAQSWPSTTQEPTVPPVVSPPVVKKAHAPPMMSRHVSVASPAETFVPRDFSCEPAHAHTAYSSACTTPGDTAESSAQAQSRWIEVPETTLERKRPARKAKAGALSSSKHVQKRPRKTLPAAEPALAVDCKIPGCNGFTSTSVRGVRQHLKDSHSEYYGQNGAAWKVCWWAGCGGQNGQGQMVRRNKLAKHIADCHCVGLMI